MLEVNQHGIKSNFLSHVISDKAVGTIHSVFNTSFNLIFQKQLIHIGKDSEGVSAFGITLSESLVAELIQAVEVGNRVRWRNKTFTIYTRQKVFTIDTNLFFEFDCRVPQIDTLPTFVIKKFQKLPFIEKTDFYLSERNRILTEKFVLANLGDRDFQEIFIHHFIGRGQGLTPSGDDMLMGIILGLKAFGGNDKWLSILREKLDVVQTTEVSDAYYQALLKGYTSSHFVDLFQAIKAEEWVRWDTLIEAISKYGHSSGWDTLFGLSLYIDNYKGD